MTSCGLTVGLVVSINEGTAFGPRDTALVLTKQGYKI